MPHAESLYEVARALYSIYNNSMNNSLKHPLQMSIVCSVIALGYAVFMHASMDGGPLSASVASVAGTFGASFLLWKKLVVERKRYTLIRGGLIGLLTGWLSLYFGILGFYGGAFIHQPANSFDETIPELLCAVVYTPFATALPLVFFGWVCLALCCTVGAFLPRFQKGEAM